MEKTSCRQLSRQFSGIRYCNQGPSGIAGLDQRNFIQRYKIKRALIKVNCQHQWKAQKKAMLKNFKTIHPYLLISIMLLLSCGQTAGDKKIAVDSSAAKQNVESAETTVPGVEKLNFTDTIR